MSAAGAGVAAPEADVEIAVDDDASAVAAAAAAAAPLRLAQTLFAFSRATSDVERDALKAEILADVVEYSASPGAGAGRRSPTPQL